MSSRPASLLMRIRRKLFEAYRWRRFLSVPQPVLWGVYKSFEEARAALPPERKIGFDITLLAKQYGEQFLSNNWEGSNSIIRSFDYPVLFWMREILFSDPNISLIVDFGGGIGVHFYAYSGYLLLPENLKWHVVELPSMIAEGESIARQKNARQLYFSAQISTLARADVFFASGVVHYVDSLASLHRSLSSLPQYLLLNRLPLYDGESFVTTQNAGLSFYPQHVFNRAEFIASLTSLGYRIRDEWRDNTDSIVILFHPERCVPHCCGLFLELVNND